MGDPERLDSHAAARAITAQFGAVAKRSSGDVRLEGRDADAGGGRPRAALVACATYAKVGKRHMCTTITCQDERRPRPTKLRAGRELLVCEPAKVLPMAQRYFLF